ncbi:acyl-CoA dehydrogenase family protein [Derxia lacustris]|uniref:acyl-CoA dehydrogenase family protein n=1 Tax=Derxia lacustris TaxID=764842 RepID=UPI000A170EDC|nr:acyl-CoA dehydrogenase family protein [Derxia lacustris]
MTRAHYPLADRFEHWLGDPLTPDNLLSFRNAIAWDEDEALPDAAVTRLHNFGLHRGYVPRALGGEFDDSESFLALGRTLARRNMSVAVSYSTMLWTVLAWIGGSAEQQRRIAGWVLDAGQFPCLAYSEEQHGADLTANDLRASRDGADYRLRGEKWPINRATRSDFLVMLARTDAGPHLRNHSLFIVHKSWLDASRYYHLPRVRTHGLRGCDISGIGFRDCRMPAMARIGAEGHGLELALKGFQVTRTYCTALSLGVGDSALRLVTDFARRRQLYGNSIDRLPHVADTLANAYLSQLMAECVALVAARGLHLHAEQFSTWSSIAKVQATHLVDNAMHELAAVLGARYYLREKHADGMFQKFLRDGAVVAVFDGSSIVCLDSLATFLPELARARQRGLRLDATAIDALYDLDRALPPLDYGRLTLFGRGRDAVIESLPALADRLAALDADADCPADRLAALGRAVAQLADAIAAIDTETLADATPRGQRNSARRFALAERYCALHGAVAALGLWLLNRDRRPGFFAAGHWLLAALERGADARFTAGQLGADATAALIDRLDAQTVEPQMYSLLPWPLAPEGAREADPEFEPTPQPESRHESLFA